jgi:hypothetical protein
LAVKSLEKRPRSNSRRRMDDDTNTVFNVAGFSAASFCVVRCYFATVNDSQLADPHQDIRLLAKEI